MMARAMVGVRRTIGRRDFLTGMGAPAFCRALRSRALLPRQAGRIGQVAFCRVSSWEWLRVARELCPEARFIAEIDPAGVPGDAGVVFLGSQATLVIGQGGWRILS
ncbi:MAG TPA: hypothetical protein VKV17_03145 [Bryobacteraceae bacterium]|nr:hypothetical protein [Bryobacteraceae bacterium]